MPKDQRPEHVSLPVYDETSDLEPMVLDEKAWGELLPPEREIVPAKVITLACAEGKYTLDTNDPRSRSALQSEFKKNSQSAKTSLERLGLHRQFVQVLGKMLKETTMAVVHPEGCEDGASSEFYIVKKNESRAERLLLLNPEEVKGSTKRLSEAFNTLPFVDVKEDTTRMFALGWVIGQKVMELANTACFLRQEYGEFKAGFGGYTPMYMARRTMALDYLSRHQLKPDAFNNPDVETERIINGFGLYYLSKIMLQHNIINSEREADWVTFTLRGRDLQRLQDMDPITDKAIGAAAALNTEELSQRARTIYPNDAPVFSNEAIKELADNVEWEV